MAPQDTLTLNPAPDLPVRRDWRIGCIGSGFIMADCHLPAYKKAGFKPVAIASRTRANAAKVAKQHDIARCHDTIDALLDDQDLEVLDVAVPPDIQGSIIKDALRRNRNLRGILAQKPLGVNLGQARELVEACEAAGVTLSVNQNMRYDPAVRATRQLLAAEALGDVVLATIEMRAIPHWMDWQERQGWVTLRIMSIHHMDTFRYWFGDPTRVYAAVRPDPRTATQFAHQDGICTYTLDYDAGPIASAWDDVYAGPAREGAADDIYIRFRIEGTEGIAIGEITWPKYPELIPSRLKYSTTASKGEWVEPQWDLVWFPDAFQGTMAQLLIALERRETPAISARGNLRTMALVDAAYQSAESKQAVTIQYD
jgi:hypothetical protein